MDYETHLRHLQSGDGFYRTDCTLPGISGTSPSQDITMDEAETPESTSGETEWIPRTSNSICPQRIDSYLHCPNRHNTISGEYHLLTKDEWEFIIEHELELLSERGFCDRSLVEHFSRCIRYHENMAIHIQRVSGQDNEQNDEEGSTTSYESSD